MAVEFQALEAVLANSTIRPLALLWAKAILDITQLKLGHAIEIPSSHIAAIAI